jgi:hypothetical protein
VYGTLVHRSDKAWPTLSLDPDDDVLATRFVLAIRNSVPGDWCGGLWTYVDASGDVLSSGFADVLEAREVGDGYTATLVLDELIVGTNCTTDGEVTSSDSNPDWVLTIMKVGKPLPQGVTVTWTVYPPTP